MLLPVSTTAVNRKTRVSKFLWTVCQMEFIVPCGTSAKFQIPVPISKQTNNKTGATWQPSDLWGTLLVFDCATGCRHARRKAKRFILCFWCHARLLGNVGTVTTTSSPYYHPPDFECRRGVSPASPRTCTRRAGTAPPGGTDGHTGGQTGEWGGGVNTHVSTVKASLLWDLKIY